MSKCVIVLPTPKFDACVEAEAIADSKLNRVCLMLRQADFSLEGDSYIELQLSLTEANQLARMLLIAAAQAV